MENEYFSFSDQRLYLDLGDNRRYINETKKLTRNNSRLVLEIELKKPPAKKIKL